MTTPLTQRAQAFARRPIVKRSAIGFGIFLVLFGLFGYFALPGIIKGQAEKIVADKLHRTLHLGKVEVSPYTLTVTVRDLKLMEADGQTVFVSFDALTVNVAASSLFRLAPVVQEVKLQKPYVHLVRQDANHYNFDDLLKGGEEAPAEKSGEARFAVHNIQIEEGRIDFEDKPANKSHTISDLKIGVPFISSLPSQVAIFVEPLLSAKVNGTPLLIKGKARPFAEPKEAVVDLDLEGVDIPAYLEYLPFKPNFKLPSARLDVHLNVSFQQPRDKAPNLLLGGNVSLKEVKLTELGGKPILKLPELVVTLGKTDLTAGHVDIEKIAITGIEADVIKRADGKLNVLGLVPASKDNLAAKPVAKADPGHAAAPATPASALTVSLGELELRSAAFRYSDEQVAHPLNAGVEKFDLAVRKVEVDTGKHTVTVGEIASSSAGFLLIQGKAGPTVVVETPTAGAAPEKADASTAAAAKAEAAYAITIARIAIQNWGARLEDRNLPLAAVTQVSPLGITAEALSTVAGSAPGKVEIKAAVNKNGQLSVTGGLGLAPLHADLALDLKGVDILPLQPYITDKVNLIITRAALSSKASLLVDQGADGALKGGFKGDVTLGNLATVDKLNANDLLRWKSLYVGGINAQLSPFSLTVDQIALSDFFARVIVDPNGRINLQDITRKETEEHKSLTEGGETNPSGDAAEKKAPAAVAAAAPAAPVTPPPPIRIRKLTLQGGAVRFTDNFIKPNYTATLNDLGGVVTGLSSDASTAASVDIRGEVNSAPLTIGGKLNPLKGDLFLDINAAVRGMELAPLSPYSGKYAGYGIEKGKLTFEVAYQLENRKLNAQNRLVLDQLTFGEKVDSPTATKLPVQLAVALLRDRNGVIDISLPIGGSLDDPQFSVGGIIVKVIVNVITKAIMAPFSLLGSLFGGGEELGWLEFDPGYAVVPAAGEAKLKSLTKALLDRPGLKLEIAGRVDPETDREGLKRAAIDRKVRVLKLKDTIGKGEATDVQSIKVMPEEYPALLARVYKDEKFPKPRNMVGLQKDLPVDEMEKLMVANGQASDDDLLALANQRAQVVKDWLVKTGQVPAERVFIVAGKGAVPSDKGKPNRVDFSLR